MIFLENPRIFCWLLLWMRSRAGPGPGSCFYRLNVIVPDKLKILALQTLALVSSDFVSECIESSGPPRRIFLATGRPTGQKKSKGGVHDRQILLSDFTHKSFQKNPPTPGPAC